MSVNLIMNVSMLRHLNKLLQITKYMRKPHSEHPLQCMIIVGVMMQQMLVAPLKGRLLLAFHTVLFNPIILIYVLQ